MISGTKCINEHNFLAIQWIKVASTLFFKKSIAVQIIAN